jgi:hypothetical protein
MGVGRPKAFKTNKELQDKIKHYFDTITITTPVFETIVDKRDDNGKAIETHREPQLNDAGEQVLNTSYIENPSILAMCRSIGITRETLCQYEKRETFSDTIKEAKARIEEYLENQLYRKDQVTGIIFNLKNNFGWKDKQEIETTGETTVNNKIDLSNFTTEQLKDMLK